MSEALIDGASYESSDGDVLPYADIADSFTTDETYVFEDPIEAPSVLAEVPVEIVEAQIRTEGFYQAEDIIKVGIERSREKGYADVKVEYWIADTKDPDGGYMNRVTLGQFLATNKLHNMVTNDEFNELLVTYSDIARGTNPVETAKTVEVSTEVRTRKIGSVAAAKQIPTFHSGPHDYRDGKSAGAGDILDD